jgi:hypothetical protein
MRRALAVIASAALAAAVPGAAAHAAQAPWYPTEDDLCVVLAEGQAPYTAPRPGFGGSDMPGRVVRIHGVPPRIDCRSAEGPPVRYWCQDSWKTWARKACRGLELLD